MRMEKYLGSKNYIRTQNSKIYSTFSIVGWLFILLWIIYQPNLTFEKDRNYVQLKEDSVQSFMIFDKGEGFKLYKNDKVYSRSSKLRPIAGYIFDKNKIIVDDEKGNRFAILVKNINSYPEGLRILNHQYRYVYNKI